MKQTAEGKQISDKQKAAPLWEALEAYKKKGVVPFHTPGHKLRSGPFTRIAAALGSGFFALDPSDEIEDPSFDNDFELALEAAESLAAELFGAQDTVFLVNGTTGGLHYFLMPVTGTVLVPRFSHQAVYSALILSEGEGVYLPAHFDPDWLIPLPPKIQQVEKLLAENDCQAMVLTHPTYYGTVCDLARITALAKKRNVRVFVDEAHGGHFCFSPDLPPTGLECGAHGVVQSTHKTLGSFTQTSMLHSNDKAWSSKVKQSQRVLQSTSPSLVFLAVLDEVRRVLALQGGDITGQTLELAHSCATRLEQISGVELLPRHLQGDPTKIVFTLRKLGLTGIEVERILRKDYNIQVELSDYYNVLALITVGDSVDHITKLVNAVGDLAARSTHLGGSGLPRHRVQVPGLPPTTHSLREAFFQEQEQIPLAEASGRVSGSFLTPYPPGVPVIVPGEQFTQDIVEYLSWCSAIGWSIRGLMAEEKVTVLKDYNHFCRK